MMSGIWILWILLVVLIVLSAKMFIEEAGRGDSETHAPHSSLESLWERYAKGEIDKEEFEERKRELSGRSEVRR